MPTPRVFDMTAQTRDDLSAVPGIAPIRDAATAGFVFNHTMLRIRDPKASLDFYTRVLGFALARKVDFEQAKFSLYFPVLAELACMPAGDGGPPTGRAARRESRVQ